MSKIESYEGKPELFSILINRSFVSKEEIEKVKFYCNYTVSEILKKLSITSMPTFPINIDDDNPGIIIEDFEFYAMQLVRVIRYFNPFKKESEKEIKMLQAILNQNEELSLLTETYRNEILGLLHFAIAEVTKGGGHSTW